MNELRNFDFNSLRIRVVLQNGEPWWIASDVCAVLEHTNPTMALQRLDEDEKSTLSSNEGGPDRNIVNEPGLYTLILGSRKPEAKAFKRWVTHKVLPEIRATGGYQAAFRVPRTLSEALAMASEQAKALECKEQEIVALEPKAAFCDAVSSSDDCHSVIEAAKILGTGQNRLFAWLRKHGYLMPGETLPYQKHVDTGLFRVVEMVYEDAHKRDRLAYKTLITGKGMVAIQKAMAGEASPLIRPRHCGSAN